MNKLHVQGHRIYKDKPFSGRLAPGVTEGMDAREAHNARRREKRRLAALAK